MTDVVLHLPVDTGEDVLFGAFVSRFMETRANDVERYAACSDAPYLMIRSDPQPDFDLKVLTFQERRAAREFSQGWSAAVAGLTAKVTYLIG